MNQRSPWEPIHNTPLDEQQRLDPNQRMERFRELREVTGDHQIVYHFACLYAKGNCITYEEAVQQIILHLIRQNQILEDTWRDTRRYSLQPVAISHEDLARIQAEFGITPAPPPNPDSRSGDAGG